MQTSQLNLGASTTLDDIGNGTVRFGPQRPNVKYRIRNISVSCSSADREATAIVYLGTPSPTSMLTGTQSGSTGDTDSQLLVELMTGQYLTVVWTGGDVGASATASFLGDLITGA